MALEKIDFTSWQQRITRIPEEKNTHPKGCGVDGCHLCANAHPLADPHCLVCHGSGWVHPLLANDKPDYHQLVACYATGCHADTFKGIQSKTVFDRITGINRTKTFANFLNIKGTEQSLVLAKELCSKLSTFVFLTMYGSNGSGKTHLCHAIANAWKDSGFQVRLYPASDLLNKYKMGIEEDGKNNKMIHDLVEIECLIIDDLAVEYFKGWSQEIWEYLIDGRYNRTLLTVITTNNDIDQFPPRIFSRLTDKQFSRSVLNTAPDYRITQGRAIKK